MMSITNLLWRPPVINDHICVTFGVVTKLRFHCKLKFNSTYLTNSKWSLSFYKKWRYSSCNLVLCFEEYDFLYQFIGHAILILNFTPSTCLIGSWTKDIENLTHTRIIKNVRQHLTLKQKWRLVVWIVNRFIRQL